MRILKIIIIALLFSSCKTQEISQDEKLVNDLLFAIIHDNKDLFDFPCKLIDRFSDSFGAPSVNYDIDSGFVASVSDLFDKEEIDYLISQKRNIENFGIKTKDFKKTYRLFSKSKIDTLIANVEKSQNSDTPLNYWDEFESKIGCIQGFSRPLISKDRKTVILKYFQISGPLSAGGFTKVFRLIDGKWIVIKELEYWIS